MPNSAQLQANVAFQVQGVEISTGNTILTKLASILLPKATQLYWNAFYATGTLNPVFEAGAPATQYALVIIAHKGAANSVTITYSYDANAAPATQFILGPGGIFIYVDPSGAHNINSIEAICGANIIPLEVVTGTLS